MTHENFHRKFNNLLPVFTLEKVRASIELQPGVPYWCQRNGRWSAQTLVTIKQQNIVTIEVTLDRLNYHSSSGTASETQQKSKAQQSTSAVLNLTYIFHFRQAKHTTNK